MSEPLSCTETSFRNHEYPLGGDDLAGPSPGGAGDSTALASRASEAAAPVREPPTGAVAPPTERATPPAGSLALVARFQARPGGGPPANRSNAVRTAERSVQSLIAESSSGRAGHTGEVALAKGSHPSGVSGEALGASYHFAGDGMELDAAGLRAGSSLGPIRSSVEVATVHAYLGQYGADGSRGVAVEFGATAIGAEITLEEGGESVTVGLSEGFGFGASAGVRDQDQDGVIELCARVSGGPAVIGVCTEGVQSEGPDPTPAEGASGRGSAD